MKIENKKGEITTKQIVTLIILIVSFVIILFLLFRLNLGRATDKEICHNSVVLKSAGKGLVGQLDCKTNYLCISGGNDCEGISPTETVKINLNKEDDVIKKEIMKVIADEMADCWWMFGEGKVDYIGLGIDDALFGEVNCALCSIISFDEKVQKVMSEEVKVSDFYEKFKEIFDAISEYPSMKIIQFENDLDKGLDNVLENIKKYDLRPRDAFHYAMMQDLNIKCIVAKDRHFDKLENKIKDLQVISY